MQPLHPTLGHYLTDESEGTTNYLNAFVSAPALSVKAPRITRREREIMQLMAEGMSTKEVANALHISFHTVESYRKNLLLKMQARNTVHLIAKASKLYFIN